MRLLLVTLPAAALAACATTAPPPTSALRCDADPAKSYIGQPASQDLGARMLAASGASVIRWVGYGQVVTMEYREGRLTVGLDAQNRVSSVACT